MLKNIVRKSYLGTLQNENKIDRPKQKLVPNMIKKIVQDLSEGKYTISLRKILMTNGERYYIP